MKKILAILLTLVLLCGCTGGRLDHTASNLVLLEWIADHRGRHCFHHQ